MSNKLKSLTQLISIFIGLFLGAQAAQANIASSWEKVCQGAGNDRICNIVRDVVSPVGQPLAVLNVVQKGKENSFQVTVPTGRHIAEGVMFQIGKGDVKKLDYSYCLGTSCVAQSMIDDKILSSLSSSDKIKLTTINFQGETNELEVPLTGFKQALNSKGITQEEFLAKRTKAAEAALVKEDEFIKKLFDAQDKAKLQ